MSFFRRADEDYLFTRRAFRFDLVPSLLSGSFPQGRRKALRQLEIVERLLIDNPGVGQKNGNAREFPIPKTPFSIIYNVTTDMIEVIRIWDQRRNRDDLDF